MISRRSILGLFSALFGGSAAAKSTSTESEYDLLTYLPPKNPVYAWLGDIVTCENGHDICAFARTVKVGEIQDPEGDFMCWEQPKPAAGTYPLPRCTVCGAEWTRGAVYHFPDGWRMGPPPLQITGTPKWTNTSDDGIVLTSTSHPGG